MLTIENLTNSIFHKDQSSQKVEKKRVTDGIPGVSNVVTG